ncbi:MAG: metal ABC transporter permease [Chloroflexi bacterium]|nr:metal ABC transporter permease [Chloroflexota bacterium]
MQIAGVLLVFSYLVVPAVCAMIFFRGNGKRLLFAWVLGLLASVGGLTASAVKDWPTGASVVAMFGVVFVGCVMVYGIGTRMHGRRAPESAAPPA